MDVEGFFDDTFGFPDRGSTLTRRACRTSMFGPQQLALREWQRVSPPEATR